MRPLEFWIIDDNQNDLLLMEKSLKRHSLNPKIKTFPTPEKCYDDMKEALKSSREKGKSSGPTAVIIDCKLPTVHYGGVTAVDGVDVAKYIKKDLRYDRTCILTTGGAFTQEISDKSLRSKSIELLVPKEDLLDEKGPKTIDRLLSSEQLYDRLAIGIYGMGIQGTEAAKGLYNEAFVHNKSCVSEIRCFSNFWQHDIKGKEQAETFHNLAEDFKKEKIKSCLSLDEFLCKPMDILFIMTGSYRKGPDRIDVTSVSTRDELKGVLMKGSVHKIEDICNELQIKDFKGLIVVITNVVEPHIMRFCAQDLKWLNKTTSLSYQDLARLKKSYLGNEKDKLLDFIDKIPELEDLHFPLFFGQHGGEFADFSQAYIQRGDEKIFLRDVMGYKYKKFRIRREFEIASESRSYGLGAQKAEVIHDKASDGIRRGIVELVKKLSTYQPAIYAHSYVFGKEIGFPGLGGVITRQINPDYEKSELGPSEYDLANLPEFWRKDIARQLEEQMHLFAEHYRNVSKQNLAPLFK